MVKHKGTVLTSGTQKGGLCYLFVDTVIPHINNVGPSVNNLPSKLWHLRLVHAPHDVLKHNTSLDISAPCSKDCLVCLAAKQSMLPFPNTVQVMLILLLFLFIWMCGDLKRSQPLKVVGIF